MKIRWLIAVALALAATGLAIAAVQVYAPKHRRQTWTTIQHGRYLVHAGDCKACHTAQGGKPFAGGRPVPTPFGVVYSTNITPDPETGIGEWSERDFYRAMHFGIARGGKHLYPAFPYPWYTRMTRGDVDAIRAYLDTVKPVRERNRSPQLGWPFSMRSMLKMWDTLYLHPGQYQPDPKRSTAWNRGAYLVNGPGHCGACHSGKNLLGAPDRDHPMQGGMAEHVFAPNLGAGKRDGLGGWSKQEIVEYLATGSNAHATAGGPMAEVVTASTQYLKQRDLEAIATYLKTLDGPRPGEPGKPNNDTMQQGRALYVDDCAGCHMDNGTGLPNAFPPLRASSAVQAAKPQLLLAVILEGARSPATPTKPTGLTMPAFGSKLDDAEIAALTTYIRNAWGNRAGEVSKGDVSKLRSAFANASH
ncbi:MAG TPA: c-type cytochrome [Rhodanobacteraceae bacterium]|nr:c-type cytochrome [Rhodanobacteraceae bacterium]